MGRFITCKKCGKEWSKHWSPEDCQCEKPELSLKKKNKKQKRCVDLLDTIVSNAGIAASIILLMLYSVIGIPVIVAIVYPTNSIQLDRGHILVGQTILTSPSTEFRLVMQYDCNLVLYNSVDRALWASNTVIQGGPFFGCTALLDEVGELVVCYTLFREHMWSYGKKGFDRLFINDDGTLGLENQRAQEIIFSIQRPPKDSSPQGVPGPDFKTSDGAGIVVTSALKDVQLGGDPVPVNELAMPQVRAYCPDDLPIVESAPEKKELVPKVGYVLGAGADGQMRIAKQREANVISIGGGNPIPVDGAKSYSVGIDESDKPFVISVRQQEPHGLYIGDVLKGKEFISSPNGRYRMSLDGTCRLRIYQVSDNFELWVSRPILPDTTGCYLVLDRDTHMLMIKRINVPDDVIWTTGKKVSFVTLEDTGTLLGHNKL